MSEKEVFVDALGLLRFAVTNKDKFVEHDPDGTKKRWVELAEQTLEAAQQAGEADLPNLCGKCGANAITWYCYECLETETSANR